MEKALNLGQVLASSVRTALQPKVLLIIFLPFLASAILWMFAGYFLWLVFEPHLLSLGAFLSEKSATLTSMAESFSFTSAVIFFGVIALVIVVIPLMWITAMLLTSILAMPLIVRMVHGREFPQVERRGKTDLRFWSEFTILSIVFLVCWVLSFVFLFIPFLGFLVPLFITAYFHYRIVLIDAMSDFATREELVLIRQKYRTEALSIGVVSALFLTIPVVNFLSPVVSAILFTSFGFAALQNLRKT